MGVVQSRGESPEATAVFDAAVKKIQDAQPGVVSETRKGALSALCQSQDLQLYAPAGAERTSLFAAWLSCITGTSMIVSGTQEDGEAIRASLSEFGFTTSVATSVDELKSGLSADSGCVIAPVAIAAAAFKASNGRLSAPRVIVDGLEPIIEHVSLNELEGFLLAFREGNPESQLVLIAQEASLHMSALGRRFLTDPKTCSIKGEVLEDVQHVYYEVGTTLLAKPQALCDLVELEGASTCVVFCNSPSDADFADVILKKRGLSSVKLIGYVPQLKLSKAIAQIQRKEVLTLVLTDVAARGVPLEEFDVVVNYSIPTDPEVYFHRYAPGAESKTKKVVSLVSPLDLSNFHYLKKMGKLEFTQAEVPSPEALFVSKYAQLRAQAVEKPFISDPSIATLVDKVLSDENVKDVIALLLHNTVSVIPALKAAPGGREEGFEGEGDEGDEGDRRPRGRGQGARGDRRDRDGGRDAGPRDNGGRDGRRSGGGRQDDFGDRPFVEGSGEEGDAQPRRAQGRGRDRDRGNDRGPDRGGDRDRGERRDRDGGEGRDARPPRRQVVVDKEARLYVGAGSKQGVSSETLTSDVISACGVASTDVHRISVREFYSFVDVPEAVADQVIEKLGEVEVGGKGDKYFVKKAVTLSIPREGAQGEEGQELSGSDDFAGHATEDMSTENGPTLLSVDDPM